MDELHKIAKQIASKGILAADESTGTCGNRFKAIGVENTEENRRAYRSLLATTEGLGEYVSGVILFGETFDHKTDKGILIPKAFKAQNILPGIKVDTGAKDMVGFPGEKLTQGLDDLAERLRTYKQKGAVFAKWRAVITIGDGLPTQTCIDKNADRLAAYAAICQSEGIVPIIEPEVLMEGTHSFDTCYQVTKNAIQTVFYQLKAYCVDVRGIILKPNMVLPGKDSGETASVDKVAQMTVKCLEESVPPAVPGITFLSGGQTVEQATAHLKAMNALKPYTPWRKTFSYGRALQQPALKAWKGKAENKAAVHEALLQTAQANYKASEGKS